jgi:hypothetical protein
VKIATQAATLFFLCEYKALARFLQITRQADCMGGEASLPGQFTKQPQIGGREGFAWSPWS